MRTALLLFRESRENLDGEYLQKIVSAFRNGGVDISEVCVLPPDDEVRLSHRIDEFKDICDNLILIDSDDHTYNLGELIASKMDTVLVENENARSFLDAVSKADGIEYPERYANLPIEATVIPNVRGAYQGYVMDSNEFTLVVLPSDYATVKVMCDKYVLPYLENKYNVNTKRLTLKYFGDENKLKDVLDSARGQREDLLIDVKTVNGDSTVELLFKNGNDAEGISAFTREVVGQLKDNIYAEFDTTLEQRLFDLLKLRNVKISVAESFTGGRIASAIIKNSGVSEYMAEGIVAYSNESKIKRLGVKKEDIEKHGAVSSIVAYQMAVGLLRTGECDLAIATTGIAGPKSDNSLKPVGLNYIAVGLKDGVHTYRYNLSGDREVITETAKNTALFLAIKKLKDM
ncbi:MAG: nicotinamide-nucleotide amidohydrolase family protein [Clostridiales bacterium]|nr:nicotinamide-nucleotide amidohydrolase family protein [Clostridiales bacterium]